MPGEDLDSVKQRLAKLLGVDPAEVEKMLSEPPSVVKKDLTPEDASRYQTALVTKTGAEAVLRLHAEETTPAGTGSQSKPGVPAAGRSTVPSRSTSSVGVGVTGVRESMPEPRPTHEDLGHRGTKATAKQISERLLLAMALFIVVLAANLAATLIDKLDRPSIADVRKKIESASYLNHNAVLKNVTKVNGQMREVDGVKVYLFEFRATFTALTNGYYSTRGPNPEDSCVVLDGRYTVKDACLTWMWLDFSAGVYPGPGGRNVGLGYSNWPMTIGQDLHFGGWLVFEKTELGWRPGDYFRTNAS
jgi:hypothetical protein